MPWEKLLPRVPILARGRRGTFLGLGPSVGLLHH